IFHALTLEDSNMDSLSHVYSLIQALLHHHVKQDVEIVLMSSHAYRVTGQEEHIYPLHAAICGLGKVVGNEYANLSCRFIDVDSATSTDLIIAEMNSEP